MHTIRRSIRARYLRISIHPGGEVVVTVPKNTNEYLVQKFLSDKADWIEKKVRIMEKYQKVRKTSLSKKEIAQLKQKAHIISEERLAYFNKHYRYTWNTVTIRAQKSRWGSCSQKGNLNFNYKIALLPENLTDYIIVHELCHLKEFNHSEKFWDLVRETIPDYKERRKQLRNRHVSFQ